MTRLVPSLPRVSNDAGLPTAILIPPSTSIDGRERDTRMITAEQVRRDMMRAIAMCRPVGQIEAINLGVNFDTPLALRVVLSPRPDASNTPNDVTFLDGWIRTRTMTAVSRLYMDRQGIWEAAMAERPRSRP